VFGRSAAGKVTWLTYRTKAAWARFMQSSIDVTIPGKSSSMNKLIPESTTDELAQFSQSFFQRMFLAGRIWFPPLHYSIAKPLLVSWPAITDSDRYDRSRELRLNFVGLIAHLYFAHHPSSIMSWMD